MVLDSPVNSKVDNRSDIGENPMTLHLTVPSMACSACAETITKAVRTIDAAATLIADLKTKQVAIETVQAESAVRDAISKAGYPVS
jgi:copper chaperone